MNGAAETTGQGRIVQLAQQAHRDAPSGISSGRAMLSEWECNCLHSYLCNLSHTARHARGADLRAYRALAEELLRVFLPRTTQAMRVLLGWD